MTIEDYRIEFGWSKSKLCREADIDMNTLKSAIDGNPIFRATAGKIVGAINKELLHRGQSPIRYTDLDGLVFADGLFQMRPKGGDAKKRGDTNNPSVPSGPNLSMLSAARNRKAPQHKT